MCTIAIVTIVTATVVIVTVLTITLLIVTLLTEKVLKMSCQDQMTISFIKSRLNTLDELIFH